jgi:formate dehydrogenase subunit gamma
MTLTSTGSWLGRALRTLAVVGILAVGSSIALAQAPAPAQLGPDTNPTARPMAGLTAPSEADMLRALQGVQGNVTIQDRKAATLVQPQGRTWRETMQGAVRAWGAWLVFGMIALVTAFYLLRGSIMIEGGRSGRTIERFNDFERFTHWMTASSFLTLALTGLNVTYGRYLLLPLLGPDAFSSWSAFAKLLHNFVAFPFILGLIIMFVIWIGNNFPNRHDWQWIMQGGGIFVKGLHPPARKFNFGQKIVFWSVMIGGAIIAISGIMLLFPFWFGSMETQQLMAVLHSIFALILIAVIIGHIYIGTLGMEGAWDAMYTGQVDERWAKEHHSVWASEAKSGGDD